jgi:cobalt-zinc-cadmium efflux system membrane fusion protein
MKLADHAATPRGRAFLWGGILLGIVLVGVLLTHGFGLLGHEQGEARDETAVSRRGDQIWVPEHSRLRERLKVAPALADTTRTGLTLPGVVESDPARTFPVLSPLAGRVI